MSLQESFSGTAPDIADVWIDPDRIIEILEQQPLSEAEMERLIDLMADGPFDRLPVDVRLLSLGLAEPYEIPDLYPEDPDFPNIPESQWPVEASDICDEIVYDQSGSFVLPCQLD